MRPFHPECRGWQQIVRLIVLCGLISPAPATSYYIATNGNDGAAGTNWATARLTFQAGINLATDGDAVWIGDGVYGVTAGVAISNGINVASINGYSNTILQRTSGSFSLLTLFPTATNAVVSGLTLRNGSTGSDGGGLYMQAGLVQNCLIQSNQAPSGYGDGGGVYMTGGRLTTSRISGNRSSDGGGGIQLVSGRVDRCWITGNSTFFGGGGNGYGGGGVLIKAGSLDNCVITDNQSANQGGGLKLEGGLVLHTLIADNRGINGFGLNITGGTSWNNIIYYNGVETENLASSGGAVAYCCVAIPVAGSGNISADPQWVDRARDDFHLQLDSPCADQGTNRLEVTTDLEGGIRPADANGDGVTRVDIGPYELPAFAVGPLRCSFQAATNTGWQSVTVTFTSRVAGADTGITDYRWIFGDGSSNSGAGLAEVSHFYTNGRYTVTLEVHNGGAETAFCTKSSYVKVAPMTFYVATNGLQIRPYDSWNRAAVNIQEAVNEAIDGDTILVSNGLYQLPSQLYLSKGVLVKGVGGWPHTLLQPNMAGMRLVYLAAGASNAVVDGFTLRNGSVNSLNDDGGGVYMAGGILRNCRLTNNQAAAGFGDGGAVAMYSGRVENCWFIGNRGQDRGSAVYLAGGVVDHCLFASNTQNFSGYGGAVYQEGGILRNSLFFENTSAGSGGGLRLLGGCVENCTIVSNTTAAGSGGGIYRSGGVITNTLLAMNRQGAGENNINTSTGFAYCCAPELTAGVNGNLTNNPGFANPVLRDFRLRVDSPCLNTGANADWMIGAKDLDGGKRIESRRVDIGAYEHPSVAAGGVMLVF